MTPHWTEQYLGKPWSPAGRGPDSFDCWGLVLAIYARRLGQAAPCRAGTDSTDPRSYLPELGRNIEEALTDGDWQLHQGALDLDVVAMSTTRQQPRHVGVWINDAAAVLHCMPASGVVLDSLYALRTKRIGIAGFYGLRPSHNGSVPAAGN